MKPSDTPKLLPCPLCGRQAILQQLAKDLSDIGCELKKHGSDGCGLILCGTIGESTQDLATRWNTRVTIDVRAK